MLDLEDKSPGGNMERISSGPAALFVIRTSRALLGKQTCRGSCGKRFWVKIHGNSREQCGVYTPNLNTGTVSIQVL